MTGLISIFPDVSEEVMSSSHTINPVLLMNQKVKYRHNPPFMGCTGGALASCVTELFLDCEIVFLTDSLPVAITRSQSRLVIHSSALAFTVTP